eukprot:761684-Hanusia_phi.AAC.1
MLRRRKQLGNIAASASPCDLPESRVGWVIRSVGWKVGGRDLGGGRYCSQPPVHRTYLPHPTFNTVLKYSVAPGHRCRALPEYGGPAQG